MKNAIILSGYNGILYDTDRDIILSGIYKDRIIKRSPDGLFRVKIKGILTPIPEIKLDAPKDRAIQEEKITSPEATKRKNEARIKSNNTFRKLNGFDRDKFVKWLKRLNSNGLISFSRLKDIPDEEKESYFERYRNELGVV